MKRLRKGARIKIVNPDRRQYGLVGTAVKMLGPQRARVKIDFGGEDEFALAEMRVVG